MFHEHVLLLKLPDDMHQDQKVQQQSSKILDEHTHENDRHTYEIDELQLAVLQTGSEKWLSVRH